MLSSIVIAGVGGQGTLLASRILAEAAQAKGLFVRTSETIGMAQRGGSVMTYDGARRASYGYRFSATDGAWVGTEPAGHTGLLLESADGASHTVRLYG